MEDELKKNERRPQQKMEDDLNNSLRTRMVPKKNGRRHKKNNKMEDDLQKMEDDFK